MSAKLQ